MKTETEITIQFADLTVYENLYYEPQGFLIKLFFSSSRVDTSVFKVLAPLTHLNQTLKIKNVYGNVLELWLCNTHNKIIANASVKLQAKEGSESVQIELNMAGTQFAKIESRISLSRRQIQKIVNVEADEELLKKVEDPYEKMRKEEEEMKRLREQEELEKASKVEKKHPITVTRFNKKDVPFV